MTGLRAGRNYPLEDRPPRAYLAPQSEFKPSDWGYGMTVCAAAICDDGESIVAICDRRMSLGYTSTDALLKACLVDPNHRWLALYAGDDIGRVVPILRDVKSRLNSPGIRTVPEVEKAFRAACAADLADRGPGAKPECEFLVCGFGPDMTDGSDAALFCVESGEQAQHWDSYAAIGSGSTAAILSLSFHDYGPATQLPIAFYLMCEAKFMADKAEGISPQTWLFGLGPAGIRFRGGEKAVRSVREIWSGEGKPRIPKDISKRIQDLFPELKD